MVPSMQVGLSWGAKGWGKDGDPWTSQEAQVKGLAGSWGSAEGSKSALEQTGLLTLPGSVGDGRKLEVSL